MRKFLLSILAMVCATAMAFAGDYTITFASNEKMDKNGNPYDNTAITDANKADNNVIKDGSAYVSDFNGYVNTYLGATPNGLKVGTSSKAGAINLVLSDEGKAKITKIVATARRYSAANNKEVTLTINGVSQELSEATTDFKDVEFAYPNVTEASENIEIEASKYCYLTKLVVTYEDEQPNIRFNIIGEGSIELYDMDNPEIKYDYTKIVDPSKNVIAKFIPAEGWELDVNQFVFNYGIHGQLPYKPNADNEVLFGTIRDADITVVFVKKAEETHAITITKNGEGTVTIKDADNNEYASGDAIPASADLTLTVAPAEGWTLASAILDGTEAPMVDGTYHIGTLTDDQTLVVTFEQAPAKVEYCHPEGNANSNNYPKGIDKITVTDDKGNSVEVAGSGTAKTHALYTDATETVLVTEPGATIKIQNSGSGSWMSTYVYIDYNGNGTFDFDADKCDENIVGTTGPNVDGELVAHTGYNTAKHPANADTADPTVMSDGTKITDATWGSSFNNAVPTFTLPADLKPGDYRIRHKMDWNSVNPCGRVTSADLVGIQGTGNFMGPNGGGIIDFTIRIEGTSTPDPVELEGDVINSEALFASIANPTENSNNEFVDFKGTENKTTYKGAIGLHKVGDAKYFAFSQNGRPFITNRTSIGKVKKVSVRWAPDAAEDAVVNVLGMNSELLSANSLPVAGATAQISKTGEVDSYEFTEDFTHVAVYLAGPIAYVADIAIVWAEDAAPETYAITIDEAVANGSLAVKNGEEAVASGDKLAAGTVLTLTATPEEGYEATAITANGTTLGDMTIANGVATGTFTMGEEAVTFSAAFAKVEGSNPPVVSKDNFAVKVPVVSGSTAYRLEVDESAVLDRANGEAIGGWPYFQSSFTMMGWYKIIGYTNSSYNNVGNVLMGHQPRCHVNYNGAFTIIVGSDGKLGMGGKFNDGSSENNQHKNNFTSDVVVPVDEWVNIAAVYNADDMTIKVYVNGELAGTRTLGVKLTAFPDDPGVLTFGSTNANCWVDEAALFNSALSEGDILVAMEKAASLNPACFYTFTETNGTDGVYANEGSMEYPAKLIKAVGTSSSDGGVTEVGDGSFTETAAEKGEGRELPNVEYCTYGDDVVSTGAGGRRTPNVFVKAGSYDQVSATNMQTEGKMKLYWDKTDVVVTANPDDTISVKMDYKSMYLHSVVFIDFNRDGQFTPVLGADNKPTAASEAVAFSALKLSDGVLVNSDGQTVSGSSLAQKEMKFTLPAGIKAGDYRMRAMVTFNDGTLDACPELDPTPTYSLLKGGIMVDMTLRVTALAKRTISIASADEALGSVAITSPATEGNSISTSEAVVMKATATDPDAYFVSWTDDATGEVVSTEDEYMYGGKGDASFTANFRQHYAVTIEDAEEGTTVKMGGKAITSGDLIDKGTELTVVCEVSGKMLTSLMINDVEKVEEYTGNGYKFTVEAATVIKPVFEFPSYELATLAVEGEGTVVVAEGVSAEGAPTGATFAEGDKLEEDATPSVIATPADNNKIESLIVNGVAIVADGELTTDEAEQEFISTYAEGKIVVYEAYVDRDLEVSAKFAKIGTAIESIGADEAGDAEFFNLQGIRVARENLVPGIYIMRNAEGARKVSVK